MIIWLASYPKSGNTLVRSMLTSYLFSKDGYFNFELLSNVKQYPNDTILEELKINTEDKNELIKNSIKCQEYFDKKNSVGFVKTHNMLFNFNQKYPFTKSRSYTWSYLHSERPKKCCAFICASSS